MFNPPHPGQILKELYLKPLELTVTDVASSIGVARKNLSRLINGKAGISSAMALRLAAAFTNTEPQYWLNLQQQYDVWQTKQSVDTSCVKVLFRLSA
jgi:addiction module HigA family antidote